MPSAIGLLNEGIQRLAQAIDYETNVPQSLVVNDVPPIEAERGLLHAVEDALKVQVLELVPLRQDGDPVRIIAGAVGVLVEGHVLTDGDLCLVLVGMVPLKLGGGQVF